nr:hypothetical protein [Tanacetum cinerariifolium]
MEHQKSALVLHDSCTSHMDLSLSVAGKLKEFASLPHIMTILAAEGFEDIFIRYMGGFWVLVQFVSNIQKEKLLAHVGVGSWFTKLQLAFGNFKLDERVVWIDIEAPFFHRKQLCINTTLEDMIFESFKIIVKGKIFWIYAKEVTGWTLDFNKHGDDFTDSDNESLEVNNKETKNKVNSNVDSEVEEIPKTIFDQGVQDGIKSNATWEKSNVVQEEIHSADPFNIYERLKKKKPDSSEFEQPEGELKYPPRYTPRDVLEVNSNMEHNLLEKDLKSNEIRTQEERFGSIFNAQGAAAFNNFISLGGLVEVSSRDKAILSGADKRPPMLENDMYDSWKSRMELYMLNRQHGRMILESVEQGPLLWPTVEEDGVTRLKKYYELSAAEAIQANCDVKATNIILQGLPPEVYAL